MDSNIVQTYKVVSVSNDIADACLQSGRNVVITINQTGDNKRVQISGLCNNVSGGLGENEYLMMTKKYCIDEGLRTLENLVCEVVGHNKGILQTINSSDCILISNEKTVRMIKIDNI